MESNVSVREWAAFHSDLRLFCLLQALDDPASETVTPAPAPDAERTGSLPRTDMVTSSFGKELLDTVRVQAVALGIDLYSVQTEVTVVPLVQASSEIPGNQPWIRYSVTLETQATDELVQRLHRLVQLHCVCRFEREYATSIAGKLVNTQGSV